MFVWYSGQANKKLASEDIGYKRAAIFAFEGALEYAGAHGSLLVDMPGVKEYHMKACCALGGLYIAVDEYTNAIRAYSSIGRV